MNKGTAAGGPIKTYDAYKDAEVEWLGQIPSHWAVKRLKDNVRLFHGYSFSEEDFASTETNDFLVKITEIQGERVVLKDSALHLKINRRTEKYKIKKGELLIALSGATSGKLGFLKIDQHCYLNQRVAKVLADKKVELQYLFYFLNRPVVVEQMYLMANVTAQPNFNNNILHILDLLPPLSEQEAIAAYLDEKTAGIDQKGALLEKKAEHYKSLKQSLINETVTHGLDKSAPLKESGINWIGQIPQHWEMRRFKDVLGLLNEKCTDATKIKLALENIEGFTGRYMPSDTIFEGDGIEFRQGDILFGKLRPYLAKVLRAPFDGSAVGDIFSYRTQRSLMSQFAQYFMLSNRYLDVINSSTAGAKMPRVGAQFMANLPVALPPLSEQQQIVDYLDKKTKQLDGIIASIARQVSTLKEFRKTLINDVVTGKIKVVES